MLIDLDVYPTCILDWKIIVCNSLLDKIKLFKID